MYLRFFIILIALLYVPVAGHAADMTVAQAYQEGDYKRILFDPARSRIKSSKDKKFLEQLFTISDYVLLSRVLVLRNIYSVRGGANAVNYTLNMVDLSEYLEKLKAPPHLEPVKRSMLKLMDEQQIFMTDWALSTFTEKRKIEKSYALQPAVINSNRRVQQIYVMLIKQYPEEIDYNKQAFFNHLYAIDLSN